MWADVGMVVEVVVVVVVVVLVVACIVFNVGEQVPKYGLN